MAISGIPPPHVRAWYSYAFAAEVYSACGLAIFLPITLEQLAREIGYYAPDFVEACSLSKSVGDEVEKVCKARILGAWVDTASFSMYVKSIAVAIQAICIISIGPLADSPYWRKRLLLLFAYIGAFSAVLFLVFPLTPNVALPFIAALLFVVGNTTYAASIVCANAFLPILAREDQGVQQAYKESQAQLDEGSAGNDDPLHTDVEGLNGAEIDPVAGLRRAIHGLKTHYETLFSLTVSRLSSTAIALGFLSGVSVLTLLLIPVLYFQGSTFSLRLAIGLSGIWWAVFTIPSWIGLPTGSHVESQQGKHGQLRIGDAWRRIGSMLKPKQIRELPNLYVFLVAWMFLSDGFHTTTYSAILFASSVLSMSASKVILMGILVQMAAVISSILVPKLQHRLSSPNKPITNFRILLYAVLAGGVIPLYTCIGLVLPIGGLRSEGEMYVLGVWFGLVYGPFLSYSRAVYTELIPPGHESTFFSLFAFTDKTASFVGPAVVGLIADLTGNLRYGFIFLLIMLVVPIPVLLRVNIRQGAEDAQRWSESELSLSGLGSSGAGADQETTGLLNSQ
uniref:Autophagy-related protein n=1 Tax=Kwoniella dejecticola CBS 10117 TaxID=1296121 RepID=A0A1A5ZUF2_9TREE|nr:UMF1 family MFS transporter [Kwoniella dejecticola CBS 10117]OBR81433.1 UMF1 family MFS transporter [Kwoniella dejecticola CBS 10117]